MTLAQAATAECGWLLPDCESSVWWSLRRRWRSLVKRDPRLTLAAYARAYCMAFRGDASDGRKRWLRALNPLAVKPEGWPSRASWKVHRESWKRIYRRAGAFMGGRVADTCDGPTTHFGGDMDDPRAARAGWVLANCGKTCNGERCQNFWVVPS